MKRIISPAKVIKSGYSRSHVGLTLEQLHEIEELAISLRDMIEDVSRAQVGELPKQTGLRDHVGTLCLNLRAVANSAQGLAETCERAYAKSGEPLL